MTRRTYTKEDVDTYNGYPSVNVKVDVPWDWRAVVDAVRKDGGIEDPRFTAEYVESVLDEDTSGDWFQFACESEAEYLVDYVKEILDVWNVQVYFEGRSGGHLVVRGLPDIEEWDAVLLAKWRKVARVSREVADGVPYQMVSLVYINRFEPWASEQDAIAACEAAEEAEATAALLPIMATV